MAQIIKHRRGSLESISGAIKRAGELLVVTGSSGISADNSGSLLFVGIDGSTVTPANKILQGSSTPNLSGASYDTSVNGIPFYNTSVNKFFILNKGGNVEVKATPNTDGSGIVSGSAQVISLLPTGTISGSSQVNADSITNFDTNVKDKLNDETVISGSSQVNADSITNFDTNVKDKLNADGVISGSSQVNADSITNFDTNVKDKLNADGVISGSSQVTISSTTGFSDFSSSLTVKDVELFATASDHESRIDTIENSIGGAGSLGSRVASLETTSGSHNNRLNNIESFSSSFDTAFDISGTNVTIAGNLTVSGTTTTVNSTTIQLGDNIIELNGTGAANGGLLVKDSTAPNTASGSLLWDSTNDYWKAGVVGAESKILRENGDSVVSGSSQITISSTTGFSDFSSSLAAKDAQLFATASNHEGRIDDLEAFSSSLDGGFVTEAELTNFSSSLNGRIVILESFSGSINTTIKNKLNAEGVISGSSQVNADSITNFDTNVKDKLNADGVISGSSQLNNTSVSGFKLTSVEASGSFTGSFVGDGSQLTGLVTALKISGSNGSNDSLDLLTDILTITGSGIVTSVITDNKVTLSVVDSSTSQKGVASFDADDFSVSSGNVSIKNGGVRAGNLNADVAGTGISLDGVDNSIEVDYGSTAGTAVEGNTSLIIAGTANEIQITNGTITLGSGGTVTIGLPDSVTIATASIQNNLSVGGSVTVTGNLFVQGSTTTVDSTTIQLGDNIIELNGTGAANGGLLIKDPTAPNTVSGSFLWDSTNDHWKGGALGSEKEFARLNATPTSGSVQVIGASGLLVNSHISDIGDVTITTDLIINGLTANSFLFADSSKTISSVVPTNAGDMIQWNGSSFVASNTIDGGTF